METKSKQLNSEIRNQASYKRHRRQRFWQIWLPLLFFGLVILGVAVLMALTVAGVETGINVSQVGDTSLIWIILPLFIIAFVIAAVLFGFIILSGKVLKNLPRYAYPVQKTVSKVSEKIINISKKAVQPVIGVKSLGAGVSTFFSSISRLFKKSVNS